MALLREDEKSRYGCDSRSSSSNARLLRTSKRWSCLHHLTSIKSTRPRFPILIFDLMQTHKQCLFSYFYPIVCARDTFPYTFWKMCSFWPLFYARNIIFFVHIFSSCRQTSDSAPFFLLTFFFRTFSFFLPHTPHTHAHILHFFTFLTQNAPLFAEFLLFAQRYTTYVIIS